MTADNTGNKTNHSPTSRAARQKSISSRRPLSVGATFLLPAIALGTLTSSGTLANHSFETEERWDDSEAPGLTINTAVHDDDEPEDPTDPPEDPEDPEEDEPEEPEDEEEPPTDDPEEPLPPCEVYWTSDNTPVYSFDETTTAYLADTYGWEGQHGFVSDSGSAGIETTTEGVSIYSPIDTITNDRLGFSIDIPEDWVEATTVRVTPNVTRVAGYETYSIEDWSNVEFAYPQEAAEQQLERLPSRVIDVRYDEAGNVAETIVRQYANREEGLRPEGRDYEPLQEITRFDGDWSNNFARYTYFVDGEEVDQNVRSYSPDDLVEMSDSTEGLEDGFVRYRAPYGDSYGEGSILGIGDFGGTTTFEVEAGERLDVEVEATPQNAGLQEFLQVTRHGLDISVTNDCVEFEAADSMDQLVADLIDNIDGVDTPDELRAYHVNRLEELHEYTLGYDMARTLFRYEAREQSDLYETVGHRLYLTQFLFEGDTEHELLNSPSVNDRTGEYPSDWDNDEIALFEVERHGFSTRDELTDYLQADAAQVLSDAPQGLLRDELIDYYYNSYTDGIWVPAGAVGSVSGDYLEVADLRGFLADEIEWSEFISEDDAAVNATIEHLLDSYGGASHADSTDSMIDYHFERYTASLEYHLGFEGDAYTALIAEIKQHVDNNTHLTDGETLSEEEIMAYLDWAFTREGESLPTLEENAANYAGDALEFEGEHRYDTDRAGALETHTEAFDNWLRSLPTNTLPSEITEDEARDWIVNYAIDFEEAFGENPYDWADGQWIPSITNLVDELYAEIDPNEHLQVYLEENPELWNTQMFLNMEAERLDTDRDGVNQYYAYAAHEYARQNNWTTAAIEEAPRQVIAAETAEYYPDFDVSQINAFDVVNGEENWYSDYNPRTWDLEMLQAELMATGGYLDLEELLEGENDRRAELGDDGRSQTGAYYEDVAQSGRVLEIGNSQINVSSWRAYIEWLDEGRVIEGPEDPENWDLDDLADRIEYVAEVEDGRAYIVTVVESDLEANRVYNAQQRSIVYLMDEYDAPEALAIEFLESLDVDGFRTQDLDLWATIDRFNWVENRHGQSPIHGLSDALNLQDWDDFENSSRIDRDLAEQAERFNLLIERDYDGDFEAWAADAQSTLDAYFEVGHVTDAQFAAWLAPLIEAGLEVPANEDGQPLISVELLNNLIELGIDLGVGSSGNNMVAN